MRYNIWAISPRHRFISDGAYGDSPESALLDRATKYPDLYHDEDEVYVITPADVGNMDSRVGVLQLREVPRPRRVAVSVEFR